MFFPQQQRALLPIFILVVASCPLLSNGFLPSNVCKQYQHASRPSIPNNSSVERRRTHDGPVKTTATSLHSFTEVLEGVGVLVAGFAGWLYIDGKDMRERKNMREEEERRIKALEEERAKRAYIEPKEYWTEEELSPYDGSQDEDGPILLAADGLVFNVYKGRNFYLPGCEYHIFAGRDATRLLARNKLEEETEEELQKALSIADRAFLATWIYTFKGKYDIVGKLEGFDPKSTAM